MDFYGVKVLVYERNGQTCFLFDESDWLTYLCMFAGALPSQLQDFLGNDMGHKVCSLQESAIGTLKAHDVRMSVSAMQCSVMQCNVIYVM